MIVFCLLYNLCTSSGSGVSLRFSVVIGALATGLKSKTSDSVLVDILALGRCDYRRITGVICIVEFL
jgi:hypothetical protein